MARTQPLRAAQPWPQGLRGKPSIELPELSDADLSGYAATVLLKFGSF